MSKAKLRGFICQRARDPAARGISITAVMRPVAHTMRLSMRFELLERQRRSGPAVTVKGGDLGSWIYPKNRSLGRRPGDTWIVNHPVAQLSVAPAYYRFKVAFHWLGAHGRVLGTVTRLSPICFQPELRPDLAVAGIAVKPSTAHPGKATYAATIRNRGASASGPFDVELAEDSFKRTRTVSQLGPHTKKIVSFLAPTCAAGNPITVAADPSDQVDDFNRANNALTGTCPGP